MSPIKIRHLSIRPKTTQHAQFFYANLVFETRCSDHLQSYLKHTQKEYLEKRIYRSYELINEELPTNLPLEEVLEIINEKGNDPESFYTGWDYNPDYGWFTYLPSFNCWRFHEFFTDNLITRALFQQIQNITYDVPTLSRSTAESELISCFESLKLWWD